MDTKTKCKATKSEVNTLLHLNSTDFHGSHGIHGHDKTKKGAKQVAILKRCAMKCYTTSFPTASRENQYFGDGKAVMAAMASAESKVTKKKSKGQADKK